jgi:TPR repeat protein
MSDIPPALAPLLLDPTEYDFGERFFENFTSSVNFIRCRATGQSLIAQVYIVSVPDEVSRAGFFQCVEVMNSLQHPTILPIRGFAIASDRPMIITDPFDGGSLFNLMLLERDGRAPFLWNNTHKMIVLFGIAVGMALVHGCGRIHSNLNPGNVFLDSKLEPRLASVGLGPIFRHSEAALWRAPEIFAGGEVTPKVDIFSYGLILYQILTGRLIFGGNKDAGERPDIPFGIPEFFTRLITACWDQNPDARPTFEDIIGQLMSMNLALFGIDEAVFGEYKVRVSQPPVVSVPLTKRGELKARVQAGDVDAMYEYAISLFEKNRPEGGARFLTAAAEGGHVEAALRAAKLYEEGDIVEKDETQAAIFYKTAADAGNVDAQYQCGKVLEEGIGVAQSNEKALYFYKCAAAQGHAESVRAIIRILPAEEAAPILRELASGGNVTAALEAAKLLESSGNPQALEFLEISGDLGNAPSFFHAGELYEEGIGDVKDPDKAQEFYVKAADLGFAPAIEKARRKDLPEELIALRDAADSGDVAACYRLGVLFTQSDNLTTNDYLWSAHYLKQAALGGHTDAQFRCAKLLHEGFGVAQNYAKAAYFYKLACNAGHVESLFSFAHLLASGLGVPQNVPVANTFLKAAADRGHLQAQLGYAYNVDNGIGVEMNPVQAAHYYRLAADQKSPIALNQLGLMAQTGRGMPMNLQMAIEFYYRAALLDDPLGQYNYALALQEGTGVARNFPEAAKYYKLAADRGYPDAQCNYAILRSRGAPGVAKDLAEAKRYAGAAAEAGHPLSQLIYGQLLLLLDQNQPEAVRYFQLSAAQGNQMAIRKLQELGIWPDA